MDAKTILILTNLAILIPLGYLATRLREVSKMAQDNSRALRRYYTKDETDKMIDLKLDPISVSLSAIKEDIKEIKQLIKESAKQ
jgi:hypothetical protein